MFNLRYRRSIKKAGIKSSELNMLKIYFDKDYYLKTYPDVAAAKVDPLLHFHKHGWKENRNPSLNFNVSFYLENNKDVAIQNVNPLLHYATRGIKEGRKPTAQQTDTFNASSKLVKSQFEQELEAIKPYFDKQYYLNEYEDIQNPLINPLEHYHVHGWLEHRNPSKEFNTKLYLQHYKDVRDAGINPLWHYAVKGFSEGRITYRVDSEFDSEAEIKHEIAVLRPWFDQIYYLGLYPDLARTSMDPLEHFCKHGWKEGRNPSPEFDAAYYLKSNPDVNAAGINPLLHYVHAGRHEGRKPKRLLDVQRKRIEMALPAKERANQWSKIPISPPGKRSDLENVLSKNETANRTIVISFSHDDYGTNVGGVQNLIADEAKEFQIHGTSYLHLSPAVPLPMLSSSTSIAEFVFSVRVDGVLIGTLSASDVLEILKPMKGKGFAFKAVIHHLMGHSPEVIIDILNSIESKNINFWAHDFFALCSGYNLMRNDVTFCNAPPISSGGCKICCYGSDRLEHVLRIDKIFKSQKTTLVAPSNSAMRQFLKLSTHEWHKAVAIPLARINFSDKVATKNDKKSKLKVAYIGYPNYNKGWNVFQELAIQNSQDFDFAMLSSDVNVALPHNIRFHHVRVTREHRNAMIDTLMNENIDIVINWPLWPETFNYVLFECLSAGVYVITNNAAGNVTSTIKTLCPERGCIVNSEADLKEIFASKRIIDIFNEADLGSSSITYSKGSFELSNIV